MRKALFLVLVWMIALGAHPAFAGVVTMGVVYGQSGNAFFGAAMRGFEEAQAELGFELLHSGPEDGSGEGQIAIIEDYIRQEADVIAVSANDPAGLAEVLQMAMEKGIQVISWNAAVNAEDRSLHVAPYGIEQISIAQVRDMARQIDGVGQIAILRGMTTAAEIDLWSAYMAEELKKDEYRDIELVAMVFGDDEFDKSYEAIQRLIHAWPDLRGIISPSAAGIEGAAACIRNNGLAGQLKLTGLGLPSGMAEYVRDGTCEGIYLWNPVDLGYCTAYAAMALSGGDIQGMAGEILDAGRLGTREVLDADDGGPCVLCDPFCFNAENIGDWVDVL